jgi:hypothetical protein
VGKQNCRTALGATELKTAAKAGDVAILRVMERMLLSSQVPEFAILDRTLNIIFHLCTRFVEETLWR